MEENSNNMNNENIVKKDNNNKENDIKNFAGNFISNCAENDTILDQKYFVRCEEIETTLIENETIKNDINNNNKNQITNYQILKLQTFSQIHSKEHLNMKTNIIEQFQQNYKSPKKITCFQDIESNIDNKIKNVKDKKKNYVSFKISQNFIKIKINYVWFANQKIHVNTKFSKYLICIDNNLKVEKNQFLLSEFEKIAMKQDIKLTKTFIINEKKIEENDIKNLSSLVASEHNITGDNLVKKNDKLLELNSIRDDGESTRSYSVMFQLDYKPLFLHPQGSNSLFLFNRDNLLLWPSYLNLNSCSFKSIENQNPNVMKVRLKFGDFRQFSMNDNQTLNGNGNLNLSAPDMVPQVVLGNKRGSLNKVWLEWGEKLAVEHDNLAALETTMAVTLDNKNRVLVEGPGWLVLRKNKSKHFLGLNELFQSSWVKIIMIILFQNLLQWFVGFDF